MATSDVESLCLAHGLQPEKAKLDAVITEDHILDIAKFITDCTLVVSYPDPNVRNDDYRLQYNITYRGSGNEVVGNGS